jgi:hypothetical protein
MKVVGKLPQRMSDGDVKRPMFLPDGTPAVWTSGMTLRIRKGALPE